tara:strand:+ start:5808 stop:6584 length:777 start_codon:yes stop_codon:yes gene_type:complete
MTTHPQSNEKSLLNKVADVTVLFWAIKIISTTVGEASADFFVHQFGYISILVTFLLLAASIVVQIRFKRYIPWMYWMVIVLVAVFGTMFSDGIHHLGLPLSVSSAIFIVALLSTFGIWYACEKSLNVHSIRSTRREMFYWTVILFTFALGTSLGDLVAGTFHFGYLDATLIFGAVMIITPILLYLFRVNKIALFWITYILTRPFGAAGADLLAKPTARGGFGFGDGAISIIFMSIIVALIIYLTIAHKKAMLAEERVG